jgi:hypothetical protein
MRRQKLFSKARAMILNLRRTLSMRSSALQLGKRPKPLRSLKSDTMTLTDVLDAIDWCVWNIVMPSLLVIMVALFVLSPKKKDE